MTETTPGASGRISTTRSWCRRLRPIGSSTRNTSTIPAVAAQIMIHRSLTSGWPMNETPVAIWCANASASPR